MSKATQKGELGKEELARRLKECAYSIYKRKDDGYKSFMDSAIAILQQLLTHLPTSGNNMSDEVVEK